MPLNFKNMNYILLFIILRDHSPKLMALVDLGFVSQTYECHKKRVQDFDGEISCRVWILSSHGSLVLCLLS
jgi:hypothetical protein